MIIDVKRLSGLQKVAILFTILGEGLSITLLKELSKTDIRKIRSVARDLDSVSFGVKKRVIEQFYYSFVSEKFQAEEGGEDEPKKPFEFLDELTDEQLISMVLPEDTKVKAIVMAQVSAEKRKKVLDYTNSICFRSFYSGLILYIVVNGDFSFDEGLYLDCRDTTPVVYLSNC